MKQLDGLGLYWTKKHGIRIEYIDYFGKRRKYIPDFLINDCIVEEVKPEKLLKCEKFYIPLKINAGIEYCKRKNLTYRIITEKDLNL